MPTYGTTYGGWWLPDKLHLGPNSFVVSAGVGEDISFDLALQAATGCELLLLDPTPRAAAHVEAMKRWFREKGAFPASDSQTEASANPTSSTRAFPPATNPIEYERTVKGLRVEFNRIHFKPVGLWSSADSLRFYKQDNPAYVSQSLLADMYTSDYTVVPVDRLKAIMEGRRPDLVKMDIEGAEIAVLETMLEDGILPRYLCVEFDYAIKGKDKEQRSAAIVEQLQEVGYTMLHNAALNVTFERPVNTE